MNAQIRAKKAVADFQDVDKDCLHRLRLTGVGDAEEGY